MNNSKLPLLYAVVIIVSITFAIRASNNMYMTTVPLLAKYYFNFSEFSVGLIATVGAIGTFLMSAVINARLMAKQRRRVFIASAFVYMLVFPLFYISNGLLIWPVFFTASFVLGALMPNLITSAGLFDERKIRERILSIYTLTLSISLVAGPFVESIILEQYTLKQAFVFFSVLPIIAFAASFFLKFPEDDKDKKEKGARSAFQNHGFRVAIYNIMAYNIPFVLILTFGGIFAKEDFGASYSLITLLFSFFFATSFISRLTLSIKTPEKLRAMMIMSVLLTCAGLIMLGFAPNIYIFALSFIILGFPHGFTYPLSIISISRCFEKSKRNAANSYFFSIMMAVGIAMPLISGVIVQLIGLRQSFLALVPVVLILLYLLIKETRQMKVISDSPKVIGLQ